MLAEIIAIGTEISTGMKLDTNSQWLSLQLAELGIPTLFHTTVADELQANIDAFRIAAGRVDLVLITGGLGPTLDDLTREAMAKMLGVPLELDAPSLAHVEGFFRSRGREMPERNRVQAMFPAGSFPLFNPIGTAPGIWVEREREGHRTCFLAALPGVPSEMKKMFLEQVRPLLEEHLDESPRILLRQARINCFGLGESHTEELLGGLTARGSDPDIGITAHEATITLRISCLGRTEEACQTKIVRATDEIRERLGDYVFGEEDEELEDVVVHALLKQGKSVATLEWGTSGCLAERLARVPGAEGCYRGGRVLPAWTGTAEALAVSLQRETGADFVLFVGRESIDESDLSHPASVIPLGMVTADGGIEQSKLLWSGNPAITKSRAAKTILNRLRLKLLEGALG